MSFTSVVRVDVKHASGLKNVDLLGKSDPYVVVKFAENEAFPQHQKTRVVKNDLNPVWDASFYFLVKDDCKAFNVEIFDHDTVKDDKLGHVTLERDGEAAKREQTQGGVFEVQQGKGQVEVYFREFPLYGGVESLEQFKRDNFHLLKVKLHKPANSKTEAYARLVFGQSEEGRAAERSLRTRSARNDGSQSLELLVPESMLSFRSEIVVASNEVDLRSRDIAVKVNQEEYELTYEKQDFAAFF
eukprot:TRINITY_DN221_c0_g1_i1.p1 TRINITY_DN221_c0_g1~~TRINITY_DN221_c0_g1_i1.p1  ORF type:complete len:243 (-),score=81.20 TRINITY_DN221_c0_g1_i1:78-806(-)